MFHDQEPSKVHAALWFLRASAASWQLTAFADTDRAEFLAAETPERQEECAHLKFTVVRFSNVNV